VRMAGGSYPAGAVTYGPAGTPLVLSGSDFGASGTVKFTPYRNGSPGTPAQAALAGQNDYAPFATGFFLVAGHTAFFPCSTSARLRSRARPTGRCGLQPRVTSSFHTWPG
jgi:hypothetical protein